MRLAPALLALLLFLLIASPAGAEDRDPTPEELAVMILEGGPGELALVAAWLEEADRADLRAVFTAVRAHRARLARREQVERALRRQMDGAPSSAKVPAPQRDERPGALVQAEVRVLQFPVGAAAEVLRDARLSADRSFHMLDATEAAALLKRVAAHEEAEVVSAPRITVHDGQEANISLLNQVSYVEDYEVTSQANDTFIIDPIVGIVQEGIVLDLTPTCSADGRHLELAFEGTFSSLQRPLREEELELHGQTVTIQLPQVEVGRIRATVLVPSGGWVLLGGGVTFQPRKDGPRVERVALVRAERIAPR